MTDENITNRQVGRTVQSARTKDRLPTYDEALTALDGCSDALVRLIAAVRGLFTNSATQSGYEAAVGELQAAHNAAVEWAEAEARRYASNDSDSSEVNRG